MRVLEVGWEILAREVIEDVDQVNHSLGEMGETAGRRCKDQVSGVEEELEERAAEAGEDIVDGGEKIVGAGCGTPWAEDGVGSF